MKTEKITFLNQNGESLAAKLDSPENGDPQVFAIFVHCFTCGKDLVSAWNISRTLAEHGWAVLRFDFTGLGESEGDFAATTFSHNVSDLIAAAEFLDTEYLAPSLMIGHSLGGSAALVAAHKIDSVKAVVTIAAPYSLGGLARKIRGRLADVEADGEGLVQIGPRTFTIRRQFIDDLESIDKHQLIADLHKPLLVLHSPDDQITPLEDGQRIFEAARQPKSFIALPGADHLLSNKDDSRYAGQMIAGWVKKYVG